jgi:hypothetical protein
MGDINLIELAGRDEGNTTIIALNLAAPGPTDSKGPAWSGARPNASWVGTVARILPAKAILHARGNLFTNDIVLGGCSLYHKFLTMIQQ